MLSSCNDSDVSTFDSVNISVANIEKAHENVQLEFQNLIWSSSINDSDCDKVSISEIGIIEKEADRLVLDFENNWEFVSNNSLEELYAEKSAILIAVDFYRTNRNADGNIYHELASNFPDLSNSDWENIFLIAQISDYLIHCHGDNIQARSWGCAVSVAATVLHTLSAVTITTPAGLGFWLAGKALATAGVIGSCP